MLRLVGGVGVAALAVGMTVVVLRGRAPGAAPRPASWTWTPARTALSAPAVPPLPRSSQTSVSTSTSTSKAPLRVLVIDGGGMRGVIPIRLLQAIKEETGGKEPHELFDVMCGTSTGGILAILLGVLKLPLDDVIKLYNELGTEVFDVTWSARIVNAVSEKAAYSGKKMEELVRARLADHGFDRDLALSDARAREGPRVVVVASRDRLPYMFRNYDDANGASGTSNVRVWEAIRATSAAPTYFPSVKLGNFIYLDGGMGRNNPTKLCLEELKSARGLEGRSVGAVVALGTGKPSYKHYTGGLRDLAQYLIDVSTDCEAVAAEVANDETKSFAYLRLNPDGAIGDVDLADVHHADAMIGATEAYLRDPSIHKSIRAMAARLVDPAAAAVAAARTPAPAPAVSPVTATGVDADKLAAFNIEYVAKIEGSLFAVKKLQERYAFPKFVEEYTRIRRLEDAALAGEAEAKHAWTAYRKTLLTFWYNFVKAFPTDAQLDAALEDVWKHRALQYLRYNELMDATNYYRRELDKDNPPHKQGYWKNRPKSYERLASALGRLGRRDAGEDARLNTFIETTLRPVVERVLAEVPATAAAAAPLPLPDASHVASASLPWKWANERFDIFISFRGNEPFDPSATTGDATIRTELARPVAASLRDHGFSVFFDQRTLPDAVADHPNTAIDDILQGLLSTQGGGLVVLLVTKTYFKKKWTLVEMAAAASLYKLGQVRLLIVALDLTPTEICEHAFVKNVCPELAQVPIITLSDVRRTDAVALRAALVERAGQCFGSRAAVGKDRATSYTNLLITIADALEHDGSALAKLLAALNVRRHAGESGIDALRRAPGLSETTATERLRPVIVQHFAGTPYADLAKAVQRYDDKWLAPWAMAAPTVDLRAVQAQVEQWRDENERFL